jgi:hypothetical protein
MGTSATSENDRLWRFTAAYRLGHRWQDAGEYDRAQAAYREALSFAPDHRASRLNLAVTQIRLHAYQAALMNLTELCKRDSTLPSSPRAKALNPEALAVVYNRALVLRYLGRLEDAKQWSERVAVAAYKRRQDDAVAQIAPAGLMLHAGILLELHKDDDAVVARAVNCALQEPQIVDFHKLVSDPGAIEWYVRRAVHSRSGLDARGCYNIACYLARLAELVPPRADELASRVIDEVRTAFSDARLMPWAAEDPALAVMRSRPEWPQRPAQPPAPVSGQATPPQETVTAHATPERTCAVDDALALLTGVHVDADERRARRARDPLRQLEQLKAQAASLDEPSFHLKFLEGVAGLRDPVTAYLAPPPIQARIAVLPLRLAECRGPDGAGGIRVAASEAWVADAGLRPGTEVTHWNGVPLEDAIEQRTALMPAADIEGRRARAIATLTHRPSGVLAPLDADEVAIRYGVDPPREIRLEWEHRHTPPVDPGADLQSIDPLVAAIGAVRAPGEPITWSEFEGPDGVRVGHLRIATFEVDDATAFVDQVAARLRGTQAVGLVLDVRGNGGGSIAAAERLLQLMSPGRISPEPIQFRATDLTAQLTRAVPRFRRWFRSIDAAIARERPFSDALPLTSDHERACNAIGRVHAGPVVLVVDALSAGATDILAAGFVDHGLGRVLATAARGGMAGGVAWRTDDPHVTLPPGFHPLPNGAALQLSVARTCRARGPLAEFPVVPDEIHSLRSTEVGDGDAGLLRHAAEMLRGAPGVG